MIDDWPKLIEQYGPLVYTSAWRILRDRQEAEDIAQDVFTYAWSERSKKIKNMAGWLRHLATCRALDRLRQRRPSQRLELEHAPITESDPSKVEFEELELLVRSAVASLPNQQGKVFALKSFEEMANREIAAHLNMSESAVSSALHSARKTLAAELTPILQREVNR